MTRTSLRLGLAVLTIEMLVMGVGGALLVGVFSENLEREMLSRITAPGRLMGQGGLALSVVAERATMRALVGDGLMQALLVGVNGVVLHSMDERHIGRFAVEVTGLPPGSFSSDASQPSIVWRTDGDVETLVAISPLALESSGTPLFYLYIQADAHELAAARRQALLNIIAAMLVAAGLSTLIINLLMRRSLLTPVQQMSDTVRQIGSGDLSMRCPPNLPGELGVLGRGLNVMADAIEANDRAMRELNLELERKYEERTCDLQRELAMRRETELQLCEARDTAHEALVAKSRFLAAASHDLRQPVHALRLLLSAAMGLGSDGSAQVDALLAEMQDSVENLSDLLNALLDVSRLDAGVIVPTIANTGVRPLLRDLNVQFQREAIMADVRLHIVESSCTIRTDALLLRRILANLIANAIKFAEGGAVLVGCRRRGTSLEIQVCDTGKGIEAASLEEIFEEFKQIGNDARQKAKGLGLGLAIVRRIAALLGHPVSVASTVKRGTVFSVSVPLVSGPVAELEARPSPMPALPSGRRVLLVDDDRNVLRATEAALRRWGLLPEAHEGAETALERGGSFSRLDALIVDYRLPGSLNGLQLITRVRELAGAPIPAILITGDAVLPDAAIPANVGVLQKPIVPEHLQSALAELWTGSV